MSAIPRETCCAPAKRDDSTAIEVQHRLVTAGEMPVALDAMPVMAMLLNRRRQVVFANRKLLATLGLDDVRQVLGRRPGEVFGCERVPAGEGGCGTGEFCVYCGAFQAILNGLAGREDMRECSLVRKGAGGVAEALDLLVTSTPVPLAGEAFLLFAITDVSHEKRRRALERIFFHDVLNTVGGLREFMVFLAEAVPEPLREDAELIRRIVGHLTDEIGSQRQLLAAESNELEARNTPLLGNELVEAVAASYRNMSLDRESRIETRPCPGDVAFVSDPVLLRRVLGNLIKNALEATTSGGTVTLGCREEGDSVVFWVRNAVVLPFSTQAHIFQRSFSTKGLGRGLGTYGARLLTERYLDGSIAFTSREGEGTVFCVRLPKGASGRATPRDE